MNVSRFFLLLSLLWAAGMIGCATSKPLPERTPEPDPIYGDTGVYALLSFRLRYTTLLNNDTAEISRCTVEELKLGHDRGLICKQACATADLLMKFEQDNVALMKIDKDAPHEQHRWCRKPNTGVTQ
jgi:hypothetical protein